MRRRSSIVMVMSAAMFCAGCDSNSAPPVAAAAAVSPGNPAPAPAASTAPPAAKPFATIGPLVAEQQADIGAERDGRIVEVAVQIGDRVRAGQLLARLDDRMLQAACTAQKARIAAAQAEVRDWKAELESVQADLRRADALLKDNILSQENWEVAKYKVDETTAQVDRYQSEQAAAEADLSATQVALDQSRIVAPFNGVVGRASARLDQPVKQGDLLFWVTAEAPLRVLFTVPESEMHSFAVGSPLEFTTADYPGLRQAGHVLRLSPVIDPASASVQVVGAVDHPSSLLKPGMSMQIRLAP